MAGPRVAYVLLWFPEPSQTFVLNEVNTLSKLGLDVKVYTLYGPRPSDRVSGMAKVAAPVQRLGLAAAGVLLKELTRLRKRWGASADRFLAGVVARRWRSLETAGEALWAALAGVYLARQFVSDGITHIHASWADGPATAAWVASKLSGIPFSFSARAGDIYPADGALKEKIQAAAFIRINNRANLSYLASIAAGVTGKIHLIYNGVSIKKDCPLAPAPMVSPLKIVTLGRFVRTKGFDVLLRAAQILASRGVDFQLTLAGSGPRGVLWKSLAYRLGLVSRVSFPGFIPYNQVSRLLAGADVFVMPCVVHSSSDRDGIPNVIMEALLHRLPVVASDVAGINEVIRDRETGLLVPQQDPAALAAAIETLIADRQAALAMAERGRDLVLRQFDSEGNYRKLLEFFHRNGVQTGNW
jgi:colanic acid/amylovoran biosynthesis glycosyltransferase